MTKPTKPSKRAKPTNHPHCPYCQCAPISEQDIRTRSVQKRQVATQQTASRHREEWTDKDYEILLRTDLTMRQKAKLTGRTFYAVKTKQSKLTPSPSPSPSFSLKASSSAMARLNPKFEDLRIGDRVTDRSDTTSLYNSGIVMVISGEHFIVRMPDGSEEEWHRDILD